MRLVAIILNFGCSFYEQITAQPVFMYLFYFVKKFTPTFKSTGRAIFYTNLIDRPAVYSTRASGLQTYSQTVWYQKYRIQSQVRQGFLSSPFVLLLCIFYQNVFFVIKGITHRGKDIYIKTGILPLCTEPPHDTSCFGKEDHLCLRSEAS